MADRDPNMSATLSGPEGAISVGAENGDIPAGELEPQLDMDEQAAREQTVARLHLLWEQRRFLFKMLLWGLVAATLIAILIPKRYQSIARLMPPEQPGGNAAAIFGALAGKAGPLMPLAAGALGLKATGDLFVGILQSQTVQDDLIQKFRLQKLYGARYIEDARQALAAHTSISQDRKSGIITVSVTDHDPRRAAAMAQEYVNSLNWVVNNLTTSSARRERVFLEERLKQVKADLESAEQQFSVFASEKGTIDIQTQGRAMVEAAATLQGQLIAAESELEALRQIYTSNNVRVRSMEARVAELRRQLQRIGGKGANEKSGADELYPSIRQLPLLGVNYADLYRRVKVQEAVFETLTQEFELAKVQEAKEIPTVKVLDAPLPPQKKSFPPRLLIMFLGSAAALSLGVVWVFGNAIWQETDPQDPRKAFVLEISQAVRAHLPWEAQDGSRWRLVSARVWNRLRRPNRPPQVGN